MSTYNIMMFENTCPRCGKTSAMEADFHFGYVNLDVYKLGEEIKWSDGGRGLRFPKKRPDNGDYTGDGYVVCPACRKDFWIAIVVKVDRIACIDVEAGRPGYID